LIAEKSASPDLLDAVGTFARALKKAI